MGKGIVTVQRRLRGTRRRAAAAVWLMVGLGAGGGGGASIATLAGARGSAKPLATEVRRAPSTPTIPRPAWDRERDPEVQIELTGGSQALRIPLEPGPVQGEWRQDGRRYSLVDAMLALEQADSAGAVRRGRRMVAATASASYRLTFSIDRCEGLTPTPTLWSPCAIFPDAPGLGHWLERRELLVRRVSTRWSTGESHTVHAACIPTSGDGPSCALEGTRTDWLDGTAPSRSGR